MQKSPLPANRGNPLDELTRWQRIKARSFLFAVGMRRRMTLGVRAMLIDGDRIFLIRHTYMPGWQLPGGGIEPGETAELSAAREIDEETGYRVIGRPKLFGFYQNLSAATNRDHVALYLCRDFEKLRDFAPNYEIAEAGWFGIDALPEQSTSGTHRRVAEVFGGAEPTATW